MDSKCHRWQHREREREGATEIDLEEETKKIRTRVYACNLQNENGVDAFLQELRQNSER